MKMKLSVFLSLVIASVCILPSAHAAGSAQDKGSFQEIVQTTGPLGQENLATLKSNLVLVKTCVLISHPDNGLLNSQLHLECDGHTLLSYFYGGAEDVADLSIVIQQTGYMAGGGGDHYPIYPFATKQNRQFFVRK